MLEVSVAVFLLQGYLTSGREVGIGYFRQDLRDLYSSDKAQ